ncbi:MAG: DUF1385 domain-containing protein [Clostridiales bacterium]|nr:DUF1385 domain-containing protein [Clostridiales bacterium]MBR6487682.1 DUF1385 domain-containing protein [Clostridiales bacterium]
MSKKKENKPAVRSAEVASQCESGKPCKKTTIGGQALIEGVMMVGPSRTAMAVRKGDGTIHVEEIKQSEKVSHFETIPFIRGCIRFYKMLVTGTGALMRSADISEEGKPEDESEKDQKPSKLDEFANRHRNAVVTFAAILGILMSIGLFILLPRLIVDIAAKFIPERLVQQTWMSVILNLVEGILRLLIFLLYLINASKIKDVKRVWQYHGAEHKTIACYEAGEDLTAENVLKFSRFHPRCGTAFMFIVLAISILIYTVISVFTGTQPMWVNLLIRLVAIPFICGISYEVLRFVGRHDNNGFCKLLSKPGLWLQKFTTDEPDAAIVEVAIASLQAVIPENKEDDIW